MKGKWVAEGLGFEGRFKEEPHCPQFLKAELGEQIFGLSRFL